MSGSGPGRRGLLLSSLGLASAGLAGCGFRPVYGPEGGRNVAAANEPALQEQLASVRVAPIGERTGQVLRRSLQRQFEGLRPGTQARYDLVVGLSFQAEGLGYRRDGTLTRVRYVATGTWILATAAVPPVVVDRGTVRTFDDFNTPDLQFFAADASRDEMERRLLTEVSDRIVIGVAVALRRRMQA
ncbi:LPS assembly lipoprotein LptE [Roseococcus sp. SYP-B2431]|uniref:LPS assembly lipoprotein LptE n=1 Tax=Roseococcus sp. SYP-B2431 TaxID=2496640 RepID=UPI0013F3C7EE|nr:LPS assembly lipoprotein LptE [Roseococcus sp. SYP-B2431]